MSYKRMAQAVDLVRVVLVAPRDEIAPNFPFAIRDPNPVVMVIADLWWDDLAGSFTQRHVTSALGTVVPSEADLTRTRIENMLHDQLWEVEPTYPPLVAVADARTASLVGAPPPGWAGAGVVACEQLLPLFYPTSARGFERIEDLAARLGLRALEDVLLSPGEQRVIAISKLLDAAGGKFRNPGSWLDLVG